MATRERSGKMAHMYKLDSTPNADLVKRAGKAADQALKRYGKPAIPLPELRATLDRELSISLAGLILKERQAGW